MRSDFPDREWVRVLLVAVIGVAVVLATVRLNAQKAAAPWPQIPGYEEMKIPADNPMTPDKVALGKQLFHDARLSGDGSRSCYSCHLKENGLTDGKPTAVGAYNVQLPRSSPTLWNIGYHSEFYWDGRSKSLEAQAKAAWSGGNMGASGKDGRPSMQEICVTLNQISGYQKQFRAVFGEDATPDNIAKALAAFERTIVANESAWVRFRRGDEKAFSAAARRGWKIFNEKAHCTNCHDGLLLTDQQYHNIGIGMSSPNPDLGRFNATKDDRDRGAFKTPTLLDIAKSAPYFHNGSVSTLEQAVDTMVGGGLDNPSLDRTNLKPVKLAPKEKADLLAFLRALDVDYKITEPTLPK